MRIIIDERPNNLSFEWNVQCVDVIAKNGKKYTTNTLKYEEESEWTLVDYVWMEEYSVVLRGIKNQEIEEKGNVKIQKSQLEVWHSYHYV